MFTFIEDCPGASTLDYGVTERYKSKRFKLIPDFRIFVFIIMKIHTKTAHILFSYAQNVCQTCFENFREKNGNKLYSYHPTGVPVSLVVRSCSFNAFSFLSSIILSFLVVFICFAVFLSVTCFFFQIFFLSSSYPVVLIFLTIETKEFFSWFSHFFFRWFFYNYIISIFPHLLISI